ncbi:reverse transcriptase domain-containing protein [Artemisia annua]|uniref:Reverse transcriptase domain-containing protein n=1 Tax=Artemisia annua TaxID=35608 RepID=A0A2U1MRM3_ARTAN|nr:reverse transcriptase domain-containing protein [Artemisia annua]
MQYRVSVDLTDNNNRPAILTTNLGIQDSFTEKETIDIELDKNNTVINLVIEIGKMVCRPKNRQERRSRNRKSLQQSSILKSLATWGEDDGVKTLIKIMLDGSGLGPSLGVKLLGGAVSRDAYFISGLAMRRAANAVDLMSLLPQLHDPQSELLLLRSCMGIAKLFFGLRTCQPVHMEEAALFFDKGLRGSIENIVVCGGPYFGDLQWHFASLPIRFGGLGFKNTHGKHKDLALEELYCEPAHECMICEIWLDEKDATAGQLCRIFCLGLFGGKVQRFLRYFLQIIYTSNSLDMEDSRVDVILDFLKRNDFARLRRLFQEVDPCEDLTDEDIRTAIQNATGPRSALFVPEVPFAVLIRRQISCLLDPSVQCARSIYDELTKMRHRGMANELQRFPVLRK